jgi:hypothetical protein
MNVFMRAARDAVATVGAAYIPFSLVRMIAYPEFDVYFVGPVEELLGVIGAGLFALLAGGYGLADIREKGRGRFAGSVANSDSEKGNVLFLILIAVALFGALTYAVTNSMRTGSSTTEKEQAKLDQAVMDNYMASINTGKMRLEMAGCSSIDYTAPADQAATGSKSCHLFHPDGGGVAFREFSCTNSFLEALPIGARCGNTVYAGEYAGTRIYTTSSDQGNMYWGQANTITGATSMIDGSANTDILVGLADGGAPYDAAISCRSLGSEWYLPARDELQVLYDNRLAIGGFNYSGSFPDNTYWTSTEATHKRTQRLRFSDGCWNCTSHSKTALLSFRCIRK